MSKNRPFYVNVKATDLRDESSLPIYTLLAPPASGKEHSHLYPSRLTPWPVADELEVQCIYSSMEEKYGEQWWTNPDARVDRDNQLRSWLEQTAPALKDKVLVTSEFVVARSTPSDCRLLILIPFSDAELRMTRRVARQNATTGETAKKLILRSDELRRLRSEYVELARRLHMPVVYDWNEAFQLINLPYSAMQQ
jgi:hypothetical protein